MEAVLAENHDVARLSCSEVVSRGGDNVDGNLIDERQKCRQGGTRPHVAVNRRLCVRPKYGVYLKVGVGRRFLEGVDAAGAALDRFTK